MAKYLIAKKFPFDGDLSESTSQLWGYHKVSSSRFIELINEIDCEELDYSNMDTPPRSYLDLKIELAHRILADCHFCERKCGADRTKDEKGWCKLGSESKVSSAKGRSWTS